MTFPTEQALADAHTNLLAFQRELEKSRARVAELEGVLEKLLEQAGHFPTCSGNRCRCAIEPAVRLLAALAPSEPAKIKKADAEAPAFPSPSREAPREDLSAGSIQPSPPSPQSEPATEEPEECPDGNPDCEVCERKGLEAEIAALRKRLEIAEDRVNRQGWYAENKSLRDLLEKAEAERDALKAKLAEADNAFNTLHDSIDPALETERLEEREACADLAESFDNFDDLDITCGWCKGEDIKNALERVAIAIRARSNAPEKPEPLCRACRKPLLTENYRIADGCPCNSPRGINHGLVAVNACTCDACDPEQTGSSRKLNIPTPTDDAPTDPCIMVGPNGGET